MDAEIDAGTLLGDRYRLLSVLGVGGIAVVWQAHDLVLDRGVAVKVVPGEPGNDPAARILLQREARAAAALSHTNIAQVHDYGEMVVDGRVIPYVVMELVPGGTLAKRLKEGPVTARFAIRVAAEIAAGLAAAHETGLVHQDVKPANVMLPPTGAKVVDFGFAAAIAPSSSGTPAEEVFGTPAYLAPERLTDDAVEPASDVYALGVVLYGMLSGESPWTVESTTQMLTAHLYVDPIPLPPQPGVPDEVVDLCNRCLAKDPAERPSARSVAALLTRHLAEPEPEPSPEPVAASHPARRGLVAAAVLLVLAGVAGWLLFRGHPAAPGADDPAMAGPRGSASALPPSRTAGPAPALPQDGRTDPGGTAGPGLTVPGLTAPGLTVPGRTAPAVIGTVSQTAAPPATSTTETTAPEPGERTFSVAAGTVTATCPSAGTARIVSWQATKPFKVDSADPGPEAAPAVTFKRGSTRTTITVTCSGSTPSASVTETEARAIALRI